MRYIRARLGVASHLSTTPRWAATAKRNFAKGGRHQRRTKELLNYSFFFAAVRCGNFVEGSVEILPKKFETRNKAYNRKKMRARSD